MRKLLVAGVLLSALIVGCETKTPVEPSLQTTTTTIPPTPPGPTTSSTTTTTAVLGSLARNFKAFPPPPPNVPSEMTLFFALASRPASSAQMSAGQPVIGAAALTGNVYKVTGVFVMGNGTTGTVDGELGDSLNPLETGGKYEGFLTANTPSGCQASRDFSGTITGQELTWVGGSPGPMNNKCSSNPLMAFSAFSMLRSDPSAPLPTPPPPPPSTTSVLTTTTTSISCSFSLTPPSDTVPSTGGTRTVNVNTQAGCAWSAASFSPWVTLNPPIVTGSGTGTVTYNVQPSTTARTASLLIAGIQFLVHQTAPPPPSPDLVPSLLSPPVEDATRRKLARLDPNASGGAAAVVSRGYAARVIPARYALERGAWSAASRHMAYEAPRVLARLDPNAMGGATRVVAGFYAAGAMRGRYALERGAWSAAAALQTPPPPCVPTIRIVKRTS